MNSFRTYDLSVKFYHAVAALRLPSHLRQQMLRAASSVALNLQEGSARGSFDDRLRFYRIAYGSFREARAILDLSRQRFRHDFDDLNDHLGASLYRLVHQCRR